jgi:hypothetical protein
MNSFIGIAVIVTARKLPCVAIGAEASYRGLAGSLDDR